MIMWSRSKVTPSDFFIVRRIWSFVLVEPEPGRIVEPAAGRDGHQQHLSLLLDGQLSHGDGVKAARVG